MESLWIKGDRTVLEMPGVHEELLWWPHYSLSRNTDMGQRCRSFEMLLNADLLRNRAAVPGGGICSEV